MSLIEILVVLAIVSVMAGVTILSIGAASRGASPETEARRLASHLSLALDEALVTGRDIALVWDERGYAFQAWAPDKGSWTQDDLSLLGRRHELAGQVRLETSAKDGVLAIAPEGDGPPARFLFVEPESVWRVDLNGLSATAAAGRAS